MRPLTDRQHAVLKAILTHYAEHGTPPTIRQLCTAVGISSTNGVAGHLKALAERGHIELTADHTSRGIRVPALCEAVRAAARGFLGVV